MTSHVDPGSSASSGPRKETLPWKRVPAKWLMFSPLSEPVLDTHLIPTKVPLREAYHDALSRKSTLSQIQDRDRKELEQKKEPFWEVPLDANYKWDVRDLLALHAAEGRRVAMIVDLSFAGRGVYYDPKEVNLGDVRKVVELPAAPGHRQPGKAPCLMEFGAEEEESPPVFRYLRLPCSRGASPEQYYRLFRDTINLVLEEGPDNHIVVHCTHGVNRTGYFVVRFLMERHPHLTLQEGIELFAAARGYEISNEDILTSLQRKFGSRPAAAAAGGGGSVSL